MNRHDIALIGFGGVNRALAQIIHERADELTDQLGFALRVVAITDLRLGSLMQADGIDLGEVFAMSPMDTFAGRPGGAAVPQNDFVIRNTTADIVVEATFTNPLDGEPAVSHVRAAIESGKSVATTNKGPVALAGTELNRLAAAHGVTFEYEGSVVSGTPILRFAGETLKGLRVNGVQGILNGTSNYVLGQMESGMTLDDAVAEAQALGYAEADPTADIEGSDVQLKIVILANEILGAQITTADVERRGISEVSAADIIDAAARGSRWKLIGSASRDADGNVVATVEPVALPSTHPLASVSGPTNAVSFDTDLLGTVTVSGPGAGRMETAYALLSDIIAIDAHQRSMIGASE
ncbi:homoserine dehydrogenase [Microbacterium mangrovi]|uniref:Homoserine dehydrogenase n=1 Tax=Microbacterium mangrovi TaxID=1348253 RepID=A0A0B2A5L7_9MICO|nr:homoserine dehydrogenase [Microbacterium mangrovi]KHK98754.1 homoserine dehydrogenase [Microbacterium mangrovi]